jgi:hypothetical protein
MKTYEIKGTYGSGLTPCTVLVAENYNGGAWYAVEGSANVNYTPDASILTDGVDVETVPDTDAFTWPDGVNDTDELEAAIED